MNQERGSICAPLAGALVALLENVPNIVRASGAVIGQKISASEYDQNIPTTSTESQYYSESESFLKRLRLIFL